MRFPPVRDFRDQNLELNQLAEDVRRRAQLAHSHSPADVTGLQAALDAKASKADIAQAEALAYFLV